MKFLAVVDFFDGLWYNWVNVNYPGGVKMLGERLKQARIEQGLSQRQLCGEEITRNMLSQIESGKARPSMQTLTYLAQKLGKPVSYFLEEETVASPNQRLMSVVRHSYAKGQYQLCLDQLEGYQTPDALFDHERFLIYTLSAMELAREAIRQEKPVYARSLLEKAAQAAQQTPYNTPALERERVLLMYEAQGEKADALVAQLSADDRELLLRAQSFLDNKAYERCMEILRATQKKGVDWHFLFGQAALGQKEYALAIAHFLQAEEKRPLASARALEACYRELEDYKMAYIYACKQRKQ